MSKPKFIWSSEYSEVINDEVYCIINRSLVAWADYPIELHVLHKIHRVNEHLEGNIASLN